MADRKWVINQLKGWHKFLTEGQSPFMGPVLDVIITNYDGSIMDETIRAHRALYDSMKDQHSTYAQATFHLSVWFTMKDIERFINNGFDIHDHMKKREK